MTQVGATVGETVDTTTKLATVADLRTLQLQIGVPAASARQVRPGETVTFSVASLPGETFQTIVSNVGIAGGRRDRHGPRAGASPTRAACSGTTRPSRSRLSRSGGPNVLVVPQAAVLTDPDTGKTSVVVVGS